jgi:hypothetical protein
MALHIKHPDAERLARELAVKTGETLTDAVLNALRERLSREEARRRERAESFRCFRLDTAADNANIDSFGGASWESLVKDMAVSITFAGTSLRSRRSWTR